MVGWWWWCIFQSRQGNSDQGDWRMNMTTETTGAPAPESVKVKASAIVQITPTHDGAILVKVKGHPDLTFNPMKASLANRRYAEFHGWKQRLTDAAAVSADTTTGKTSPEEKWANIKALVDFYETGAETWARARATADGAGAKRESAAIHLVIPAMIELGKARDVDHANGLVGALAAKKEIDRDAALKLLLATADVGKKVAEMKLAQKTFAASADELLAGL